MIDKYQIGGAQERLETCIDARDLLLMAHQADAEEAIASREDAASSTVKTSSQEQLSPVLLKKFQKTGYGQMAEKSPILDTSLESEPD